MYNRPNDFYDSCNFTPAKVCLLIFPYGLDYGVKCMLKSLLVDKHFLRQPIRCLSWKSIWLIWNFKYLGSCNDVVEIWSIYEPCSFICLHNDIIKQCKDKYTAKHFQQIYSLYLVYSCPSLVVLIIWVTVKIKRPLAGEIISDWN